ncbi:MAG: MtnX-like HAD-IB family phosphatase [bacterium]
MERNFKIFVDFDGTITKTDVGEEMFLRFGNPAKANEIINDWIKGDITAAQCWQKLCATIECLELNDFDRFLNEMNIDESFKEFTELCKMNGMEMHILSDGLDYYIGKILDRENLSHINLYSNKVEFENGKLIPVFPHPDEECIKCANCKRNHIINNSSDEDITVYIGDGWSDTCAAQYCDFIFAKNSLLKYCESNRISYFPFKNFSDVSLRMKEIISKKRIKKRHQAELKRREVYLQG